MTPSNILDITQTQNAASTISITNASAGASARSQLSLGGVVSFFTSSSGYSPTGPYAASQAVIQSYATNGLLFIAQNSGAPIIFGINTAECARFTTGGQLCVGTTTAAGAMSNVTAITGGAFSTNTGSTALTTNVAATIITIPSGTRSSYIVTACLNVQDATNYGVASIITADNSSVVATALKSAGNMTITVSGYNIQLTTTAGGNSAYWSIIRLNSQ